MEPGDEHFVDLPKARADLKVLQLNAKIEKGLTGFPKSTTLIIGSPKSGKPDEVGVYVRKNLCPH